MTFPHENFAKMHRPVQILDALHCIRTRRSIREFGERTVPPNIIEDIVDAGRLAPTANNIQPWEFVVVTREETRVRLAEMIFYGKFIAQAPVCIVTFCTDTKYYIEDASAATQNMLLAAWASGISSCWIAGDKKPYAEDVRKLLNAPTTHKLATLAAFGYSRKKVSSPKKRKLEEVLHWEKWGKHKGPGKPAANRRNKKPG
jgi:nitroreductase